jgi:D-arabinose 1-dehydrogenase-like Zn-dependent alcohol dehydrogenase
VQTGPGQIEFREVPNPDTGLGNVHLRIRRIGVCDSDIHVWHGEHPFTTYPVVQGHEYCATVQGLGAGVSDLRIGSKVTAPPQTVCEKCATHLRGDCSSRNNLKVQGFQAPGSAQDLFVAPKDRVSRCETT